MKPAERKRLEKKIRLLYSLYEVEDDEAELIYMRGQLDALCMKVYGTKDAPTKKEIRAIREKERQREKQKETAKKITLEQFGDLLNHFQTYSDIQREIGIHQEISSKTVMKYFNVEHYVNTKVLDEIVNLLNEGWTGKDIAEKFGVPSVYLSAIVSILLLKSYKRNGKEHRYESKYFRKDEE